VIHLELERLNHFSTVQSKSNNDAWNITYHKVHLLRLTFNRRKDLQIVAEFKQSSALRKKSAAQREKWWKSSKQLQINALLCLVSSTDNIIFFSVCDSVSTSSLKKWNNTEEELATSLINLNTDSERAIKHSSLFKHADRATVMLSMLKDNMKDIIWINDHLEKTDNLRQSLVEFFEILLSSFRSTLQTLQQMSRTLDLSFFEFIASMTQGLRIVNISSFTYSQECNFVFSLNSLTEEEFLKLKSEKQFDYQMLRSKFTLNDAQQIFTVNALSRCLALIQESSDIKKSYTNVAIIKTLLKNYKTANLDSIVCICYMNHALDQLLEHLVKNKVE